jgi:hypothetical protein
MKTLHEMCESRIYEGIGKKILGSEGARIGRVYMMLAKEYTKTRGAWGEMFLEGKMLSC